MSSAQAPSWCTIECDPGVFTELIAQMGVTGAQVEELYTLEPHVFDDLRPVHGLIFLFKWAPDAAAASRADEPSADAAAAFATAPANVFFASQVINNACATQAILSVLLNLPDGCGVDVGPELRGFRDFVRDFPPEMKGLAISNSDTIRAAHNSFARPEQLELAERPVRADDDDSDAVFHFIAYVPVNGVLYEMDGLQPGPVALGNCADRDWLDIARPAIQRRIERYSRGEIRFNLLAIVANRRQVLADELSRVVAVRSALPPDSAEAHAADVDIARLGELITHEDEKIRAWHAENIRRKHNFVPFIATLLKVLAESGHLEALLKRSAERQQEKQQQQQQQQKKPTKAPQQQPPEPMQE